MIYRRNRRLLTENVVRKKVEEEKKTMEKEIMINASLTTMKPRN